MSTLSVLTIIITALSTLRGMHTFNYRRSETFKLSLTLSQTSHPSPPLWIYMYVYQNLTTSLGLHCYTSSRYHQLLPQLWQEIPPWPLFLPFLPDLCFCPFSPSVYSQPSDQCDPIKSKVPSHSAQCPYLQDAIRIWLLMTRLASSLTCLPLVHSGLNNAGHTSFWGPLWFPLTVLRYPHT